MTLTTKISTGSRSLQLRRFNFTPQEALEYFAPPVLRSHIPNPAYHRHGLSPDLPPPDRAAGSQTYFVLVEDIENKGGEFGWVAKGEELLIDLLKAGGIELPAGAVLDKALVPAKEGERMSTRWVSPLNAVPQALGSRDGVLLQWAGAGKVPGCSLCRSHRPPATSQPRGMRSLQAPQRGRQRGKPGKAVSGTGDTERCPPHRSNPATSTQVATEPQPGSC